MVKPTVCDRFSGSISAVQVTLDDTGTLDPEFTNTALRHLIAIGVDAFDIKVWHSRAAAVWAIHEEIAADGSDDATGFCHPVARAWTSSFNRAVNFSDQIRLNLSATP